MQGPTGSQTKSCEFKGLRDLLVSRGHLAEGCDHRYLALFLVDMGGLWLMRRVARNGSSGSRDSVDSHVRAENLGNHDGAVSLLVVLHDRNPGAADGESRAV
jgi:hypothetical protein